MASRLKYQIENLEWQQFELLAFKCLRIDISPSLMYLDGGHDKGRDFLYEGVSSYFSYSTTVRSYVFQAKHKSKLTDYSSLKRDLLHELKKVYLQNHQKYQEYCLVTNLRLTGDEYDGLVSVFHEFKNKNKLEVPEQFRVYSYRQFESCLDENLSLRTSFPSIMQIADLKSLLEEIVKRTEKNLISAWLRVFEKNAVKFVYTKVYENSLNELMRSNAILLSGPPKSGKSFTAEMLAFNLFISEQFFPYIINNIDAYFDFHDFSKKQLFLFDDSIGKHSIESYRADSLNRSIASVLEGLDDSHKIIFTSREYIIKDYTQYSDADSFLSKVTKINASSSDWSSSEKESLFIRYYKITYHSEPSDYIVSQVIKHKNFEPETIRAFFDNHTKTFSAIDLTTHLNKPDEYLQKFFDRLDDDKKVVLLSTLFSINGTEKDIGYTFNNVRTDLGIQRLINLKLQVEILQDSVVVKRGNSYHFLHPSMFDFFVQLISTDFAIYRKLMFSNINLSMLSEIRLVKSPNAKRQEITLEESDLSHLGLGLERIVANPAATLFEINSIFAWFANPQLQLLKKAKNSKGYNESKQTFIASLKNADYSNLVQSSSVFHAIDFIKNVNIEGTKNALNETTIEFILKTFKNDPNYWQLALRASSFLTDQQIPKLFGQYWLNDFSSDLKKSIDSLGKELFGEVYPEFNELKQHKEAAFNDLNYAQKNFTKMQSSYYMRRTDAEWYPKYVVVRQKMALLKSCHPHGYKIYSEVIENFEVLKRLEDHQKKRYSYKLKNRLWDMINGHQPKFIDDEEYERMEEEYYYSESERRKEEEE